MMMVKSKSRNLVATRKNKRLIDVANKDEEEKTISGSTTRSKLNTDKDEQSSRGKKKLKGKMIVAVVESDDESKEEINEEQEDEGKKYEPVNLKTRISPVNLKNVIESLTDGQMKVLEEMGFGNFRADFNFDSTPTALAMWVCKSFDAKNCILTLSNIRNIKVTREMIHDILGIPIGDIKVVSLPQNTTEDPTTARWRATLPLSVYDPDGEKSKRKIPISRLESHLTSMTDEGWVFKIGFLVGFFSIFAHANKDGTVNQRFLPSVEDIEKVPNLDWCTYCLECMQADLKDFKPRNSFAEPDLLLVIKIALGLYPEDEEIKNIVEERNKLFLKAYKEDKNDDNIDVLQGGNGNDYETVNDEERNINVEKDCNSNGLQVVNAKDGVNEIEHTANEVQKVQKSDAPASVADSPRDDASDAL
ncbi:ulp1 protease family, C-terminal catalytic domain-containing protein [Artemisia annua]|uniref:Ulp1 protease family, C-terminal catalytic domain-containing protein n=1 Tax=Artemisia annua TaxID=35608 RepID=A0A2U1LGJ2_ARTAN|nr:ulp1 protease family, C-terminal catalytic domain-containing protein [Artemisia annua]